MSSDSDEYVIPLSKMKLVQTPLYLYEQVILTKKGVMYLGHVVSHMSLRDWAEMKGYSLSHYVRRRYAMAGEGTYLTSRPLRTGVIPESNHPTVVGMQTVSVAEVPPPSSIRRSTLMGIPLPSTHQERITPMPIKIIG